MRMLSRGTIPSELLPKKKSGEYLQGNAYLLFS